MDEQNINGDFDEPTNGPDQVLPATSYKTWEPQGCVRLCMSQDGPSSEKPVSVHTFLKNTSLAYPNHPALAVKRDGVWRYWTFTEYFEEARTVAKAFIKLGLERFHGVCIMGFNAPEWVIASYGAVFAGGFSVGVYTTNSPEACQYQAQDSRSQIVIVDDVTSLNKFLAVKRFLPDIKAIVQWSGVPGAPGVMSWAELLAVGRHETDSPLNHRLSLAAINQCCTLIYTSGTTGPPKGVMCSQDHLTWVGRQYEHMMPPNKGNEREVSYLPLSHLAAHLTDIYCATNNAATVYFAQPDALKGSLLQTLLEVQPTCFLGVPRVWEKIYEKMQEAAANIGGVKKAISTWAKYHGLNYYKAILEGRTLTTYESMAHSFALKLLINRVKDALGLGHRHHLVSGAAPISHEVLEYFMSLDLPVMEGYGLSESMSLGSINLLQHGMFRIGSVGKVVPQTELRLKELDCCKEGEGEIIMKGRNIFMGYFGLQNKTNETIDDEGWMYSGDIGSLDSDGFLYITGRIKELVITAGGENIPPVPIETAVKKLLPIVSNAMLVGDKRKFLSLLLTLKTEVDEDTNEAKDILTKDVIQILNNFELSHINTVSEARENIDAYPKGPLASLIQHAIQEYNEKHAVSNAQKIRNWCVLPCDFTYLPGGELNNTLKLKRQFVLNKYKEQIDAMYSTQINSKL